MYLSGSLVSFFSGSDAQHMQCYGWSTTIRSFRPSVLRSTFTPKRDAPRFTFPTRPVVNLRPFGSGALANVSEQSARRIQPETPPKLSPAALARAASQTIRMCGKEKQFGDALYILNSMRFSMFPTRPSPRPEHDEPIAPTQNQKQKRSKLFSSTPSLVNGYTFIDFGRPVPTRLASHSFLHTLVKAGLPTKAAKQAGLMMADGIRIRTKTMESILASTIDQSSYPPGVTLLNPSTKSASRYPIVDKHTRIAVRLLEEARHRRQERTQQMYDVVINACLLQGEIIVASLLFLILIKDWQIREALKNQCPINPPEPSEPLIPSPLHGTRLTHRSLLERIDHTLTTRKDPRDPLVRNAIQALANLAFAVDTGQFPRRYMGGLIKAFYSVPRSNVVVHIGFPGNVQSVDAYSYIHRVLMRLVCDAGRDPALQHGPAARQKYNTHALNALLHYCLRHRQSKGHASDLLKIMEKKYRGVTLSSANVLLRSSTLLRDDTILEKGPAHTTASVPIRLQRAQYASLPLTRWAHIVNVLKLELTLQYPSNPVIRTSPAPDPYTVTSFITHLIVTGRHHIVAEKLAEIIPELNLVDENGSRIALRERGRYAVTYGPYFFATVLNALAKGFRTVYAQRVWRLAVEAEKASWTDGNKAWFLPIHASTSMLQLCSQEGKAGKVIASSRGNNGYGRRRRRVIDRRTVSTMVMGEQVFRAVQARCKFLEAVKKRGGIHSTMPVGLRNFAPDERYFNALLDLYGRCTMTYARPWNSCKTYWTWMERLARKRFVRRGETTVHWHPILAEIIAEMRKYGYKVPIGFRFLLVGRTLGVDIDDPEPLQPVRPAPLPRQTPHQIPVLKTRGLPVPRGKPRKRVRRGV